MSDTKTETTGDNAIVAMIQQISKALAFLAIAFAFVQVGVNIPSFAHVANEQVRLSSLQIRQVENLLTNSENLTNAMNDAALIYAARMAVSEKAIPPRNGDQIVDAATDRLAGRFGKDWEVLIRGAAAKLDTISRR